MHRALTPESYFFNAILDTQYDILTTNLIGELANC